MISSDARINCPKRLGGSPSQNNKQISGDSPLLESATYSHLIRTIAYQPHLQALKRHESYYPQRPEFLDDIAAMENRKENPNAMAKFLQSNVVQIDDPCDKRDVIALFLKDDEIQMLAEDLANQHKQAATELFEKAKLNQFFEQKRAIYNDHQQLARDLLIQHEQEVTKLCENAILKEFAEHERTKFDEHLSLSEQLVNQHKQATTELFEIAQSKLNEYVEHERALYDDHQLLTHNLLTQHNQAANDLFETAKAKNNEFFEQERTKFDEHLSLSEQLVNQHKQATTELLDTAILNDHKQLERDLSIQHEQEVTKLRENAKVKNNEYVEIERKKAANLKEFDAKQEQKKVEDQKRAIEGTGIAVMETPLFKTFNFVMSFFPQKGK